MIGVLDKSLYFYNLSKNIANRLRKTIAKRQKKEKEVIKELKKKVKLQQEEEKLKRWRKIGETVEKATGITYNNDTLIAELIDLIKNNMQRNE